MRIVQRPLWTILIATLLGICYTWLGIFLAANGLFGISGTDMWPASVYITSLSFGIYLPVRLLSPWWIGRKGRRPTDAHTMNTHTTDTHTMNTYTTDAINRVPTFGR